MVDTPPDPAPLPTGLSSFDLRLKKGKNKITGLLRKAKGKVSDKGKRRESW